jgi:hypothetical protein
MEKDMSAQTTIIITIAIVLMIISSVTAFSAFSFAVETNSKHGQNAATTTTAAMTIPSKITAIPVAHNGTLTSGGATTGNPCYGIDYLWDHVYGKVSHSSPPKHRFVDSGGDYGKCITVTGTVLSNRGEPMEDGDLHFTLVLDDPYRHYSSVYNTNECLHHNQTDCRSIIVEVTCWQSPTPHYIDQFKGDYGGKSYCQDVHNVHPGQVQKGDRLSVSGKFVKDIDETVTKPHAAWNEIHPATHIERIP